ncbi:hypothetical protein ACSBR2_003289 [Camellia fascicularis]
MMRLTEAVGKKIDEGTHKTEFTSSASIYRVPDELRKLNESAYVPRLVSIGPLHSEDRNNLKSPVHNIKLSYVNFLLCRSTTVGSDQRQLILLECLTQMTESLEEAKKCYAEEVYDKLEEEMLVIDGCFILDMTCYCSRTSFLSSFSRESKVNERTKQKMSKKADYLHILDILHNLYDSCKKTKTQPN